jgi:hypothetical protein
MANIESVSPGNVVVCRCQDREYTARETIDSAFFRGELAGPWFAFLERNAAADKAGELDLELDEEMFDGAVEKFRYEHDLITADETDQWLAGRGLTLDDFSEYFDRLCWGNSKAVAAPFDKIDYYSAPAELRDTFTIDLILSDQLGQMTTDLSWRLAAMCASDEIATDSIAAAKENFLDQTGIKSDQLSIILEQLGRDEEWLNQQAAMEAAFRKRRDGLVNSQTSSRELSSLRLPLTKFETEVIQVESRDAAKEALFCVREDGMSMEEVANESRYPYRRSEFLLEDLDAETQQRFLIATSGQLMDPIARGDGFEVCRVIQRVEPQAEDPAIQARLEHRTLGRHFAELTSKHVTFPFVNNADVK